MRNTHKSAARRPRRIRRARYLRRTIIRRNAHPYIQAPAPAAPPAEAPVQQKTPRLPHWPHPAPMRLPGREAWPPFAPLVFELVCPAFAIHLSAHPVVIALLLYVLGYPEVMAIVRLVWSAP